MGVRDLVYGAYERRLERQLDPTALPRHVGVILDGNRRWARTMGATASHGHERGADKIVEFLGWCDEAGVEVVTLWLLSTDNLNRPREELAPLLGIIERSVTALASTRRWRVHPVGALDLLPADTARVLKEADDATRHVPGLLVNVAVYVVSSERSDPERDLLAAMRNPESEVIFHTQGGRVSRIS